MSESESTKSRTQVEDLPRNKQELSKDEQKKVMGGSTLGGAKRSVDGSTTDIVSDPLDPNVKRTSDGSTTD